MQKYFRYKWHKINLDKAFVQKCNGYKGPTDFFVSWVCLLLSRLAFDCARSPDSAQRWRSWIGMVSSLKSKEKMEQRNLLGFCDYVTLLTMICMRLNMRNRIFVLPREKCNDSLKMKERGGGGGEDDDDDDDVYWWSWLVPSRLSCYLKAVTEGSRRTITASWRIGRWEGKSWKRKKPPFHLPQRASSTRLSH